METIGEIKETCFEYTNDDKGLGWFSSNEKKWVNKIKKLKEKYPESIKIEHENKDGSILARVPTKWFKISPPKTMNYTDEQKQAMAERMKKMRENKI